MAYISGFAIKLSIEWHTCQCMIMSGGGVITVNVHESSHAGLFHAKYILG